MERTPRVSKPTPDIRSRPRPYSKETVAVAGPRGQARFSTRYLGSAPTSHPHTSRQINNAYED